MKREIKEKLSLNYQLKTFRWAYSGIVWFFKTELKATIHLLAACIAVLIGLLLQISSSNWLWVMLAIFLVFFAEIVNTIIENIVNTLSDKHDKLRGHIKDLAAAGVLVVSVFAIAVALLVFVPNILEL